MKVKKVLGQKSDSMVVQMIDVQKDINDLTPNQTLVLNSSEVDNRSVGGGHSQQNETIDLNEHNDNIENITTDMNHTIKEPAQLKEAPVFWTRNEKTELSPSETSLSSVPSLKPLPKFLIYEQMSTNSIPNQTNESLNDTNIAFNNQMTDENVGNPVNVITVDSNPVDCGTVDNNPVNSESVDQMLDSNSVSDGILENLITDFPEILDPITEPIIFSPVKSSFISNSCVGPLKDTQNLCSNLNFNHSKATNETNSDHKVVEQSQSCSTHMTHRTDGQPLDQLLPTVVNQSVVSVNLSDVSNSPPTLLEPSTSTQEERRPAQLKEQECRSRNQDSNMNSSYRNTTEGLPGYQSPINGNGVSYPVPNISQTEMSNVVTDIHNGNGGNSDTDNPISAPLTRSGLVEGLRAIIQSVAGNLGQQSEDLCANPLKTADLVVGHNQKNHERDYHNKPLKTSIQRKLQFNDSPESQNQCQQKVSHLVISQTNGHLVIPRINDQNEKKRYPLKVKHVIPFQYCASRHRYFNMTRHSARHKTSSQNEDYDYERESLADIPWDQIDGSQYEAKVSKWTDEDMDEDKRLQILRKVIDLNFVKSIYESDVNVFYCYNAFEGQSKSGLLYCLIRLGPPKAVKQFRFAKYRTRLFLLSGNRSVINVEDKPQKGIDVGQEVSIPPHTRYEIRSQGVENSYFYVILTEV